MKPISSAISGLLSRAQEGASSTGPQHGGRGVVTAEARAGALARLMANTPEETDDKLLTWLKSQGVGVSPEIRLTYPVTGGYRREVTGFTFSNLSPEVQEAARGHVSAATASPDVDDCEAWVTTMHAVMAHRGSSETALEIVLTVYAGCLRQYPADVGKTVCREFALRRDKPNWFPTLSELDEACERRANQRQKLLQSLA